MLAADSLLQALSDAEKIEDHKAYNDDRNFSQVLENLRDSDNPNYNVMCSDGEKRNLFFNN